MGLAENMVLWLNEGQVLLTRSQVLNLQKYKFAKLVMQVYKYKNGTIQSQLSITFAVFDVFVCISFMCLRVHVDLIQPLGCQK